MKEVKGNFKLLFANSVLYLVVSFLVFSAFIGAPVALVMAIKRLQIFFILILGLIFLKDKPTKHAWIATAIMAFGALLIKLG
jgi:drug/metabolite transporter (DMT)-like permease